MEEVKPSQFSLFCDLEGRVIQIIQDENNCLPVALEGNMLFAIVAAGDLNKMLNFYSELKQSTTAIGWEINIGTPAGIKTFMFFGGIFGDKIGIAASTTKNGAQLLFTEMTRINNEQINLIRSLTKENERLQRAQTDRPISYFEELSRLNNELVNIQRELAKKNRELDELSKLKNQFLGIAAHDLRNPLGVIMGFSAYILEEDREKLTEDQIMMLEAILTSSEFMRGLINNLLDVSAIESGKLELDFVKGDLILLINKNISLNRIIAQKKNIDINFIVQEEIPEVYFDNSKIEQVINNLLSNAIKFSKPGTLITVEAVRKDKEVVVSVIDQGQGIPEEELEKLFKPFSTTSVQSTAGEKSTGLGLSIVRNVILKHQGKVWVDSRVGKGSTFYFSLPLGHIG